jgi:hypothetical protein
MFFFSWLRGGGGGSFFARMTADKDEELFGIYSTGTVQYRYTGTWYWYSKKADVSKMGEVLFLPRLLIGVRGTTFFLFRARRG